MEVQSMDENSKTPVAQQAELFVKKTELSIELVPVINFALKHNGIPVASSVQIRNLCDEDITDVKLEFTCNPAICMPLTLHIDLIPARSTVAVNASSLSPDAEYLAGLTEGTNGRLSVSAYKNEVKIGETFADIKALAFDEWHGSQYYPELISAFITPNSPELVPLMHRTSELVGEWTDDPSLDSYLSGDPNRVLKMAAAAYEAVRELGITYAVHPASFEETGQRIRLIDAVISDRLGNCIDISLLYASLLEAMGLSPLLILLKGHIFAGLWLEDRSFPEAVLDDPSLLSKRLADGVNEAAIVECTLARSGSAVSFDDASAAAKKQLKDAELIIDVRRARLSGIKPLPARIKTDSGIRLDTSVQACTKAAAPPRELVQTIDTSQEEATPATRKASWERKLLDLGLRNTLVSMRMSKTLIPIITTSIDDLEDALADGEDFAVMPRPQELGSSELSFEDLHQVEGIGDIITSEFRNHRLRSVFTETELNKSIKELYRASKASLEENGANTLYIALGLIKWFENPRSTRARYAPILMVPIEMIRKSAAQGYIIRLRDDEAQINVTILEKLKQDFEITVTGLDTLPVDDHGIDTRKIFTIIRKAIIGQKNWDVFESAYIGVFSFSQFVMWNDIRARSEDLEKNKIVKSLIEGRLQWDADEMTIGDNVPEDKALLPLPADASQLFAIEAACDGESFVLHGPPGTGKSQTITALIANALANDKTVLFVAEKMAALEVVQRRLEKIGLGPFCLELHSNKARKKAVLEQLRRSSEVTKDTPPEDFAVRAAQISNLRTELDAYNSALHQKQKCGKDVYELVNIYEKYRSSLDISPFTSGQLDMFTSEIIYEADTAVDDLIAAAKDAGNIAGNPLQRVGQTQYSRSIINELPQNIEDYRKAAENIKPVLTALSSGIRFPLRSFADIGKLNASCAEALKWEEMPSAWGRAENLNVYLANIREMCNVHISAKNHLNMLTAKWQDSFFSLDAKSLLNELREANAKMFLIKGMAVNAVVRKAAPHSRGTVNKNDLEEQLITLSAYQDEMSVCQRMTDAYAADLGSCYNGRLTDWNAIGEMANNAQALADRLRNISGSDEFRLSFCSDRSNFELAKRLNALWENFVSAKDAVYRALAPKESDAPDIIDAELRFCRDVNDGMPMLREWIHWNSCAAACEQLGLRPVIRALYDGVDADSIKGAYKKAQAKGLANKYIDSYNALNRFTGPSFEKKVEQLKALDNDIMELTRKEIYCRLAAKVPNFAKEGSKDPQLASVMKLIRNGGRGVSIRKLFEQLQEVITRLCPCMLMSPISAAQYLDPHREPFDLVVFDEASQMQTCKAVGALARGRNAVIVGDPKQMPPTSFFSVGASEEEDFETEDLESILDDCLAINMPQTNLLWHYRSRHESLIAFSNRQFYENKLFTFPSVNDREKKVRLIHVDGVFDRGKTRQNRAEAEAVVEELRRRAHSKKSAQLSVGIVTFNIMQQNLIDDLLNEACKNDPVLEAWAFGGSEPLFIKNLENVQGDERDVILFSVGYGPDADGKVTMNFGPLNREGGWRRLNVAVSRARCEMAVYSSLTADMINLSRTSSEGVAALRSFLEYASGKAMPETSASACRQNSEDSAIADTICRELGNIGFSAVKNVGKSEYKIDIGVIDPEDPDKYLLGILLDGSSYSASKTTRDREIAQISVLEGLGWSLLRVWSIDWWDNPRKELDRVFEKVREEQEKSRERRSASDTEDASCQDEMVTGAFIEAKVSAVPERPAANAAAPDEAKKHETPDVSKRPHDTAGTVPEIVAAGKTGAARKSVRRSEGSVHGSGAGAQPETVKAPEKSGTVLSSTGADVQALAAKLKPYKIFDHKVIWLSEYEFMERANSTGIRKRLEEIVSAEAPISEKALISRLFKSFALESCTDSAVEYCRELISESGFIRSSDAGNIFIWAKGTIPGGCIALRINGTGQAARTSDDIPLEEAVNAVYVIMSGCGSAERKDIAQDCARLIGLAYDNAAQKLFDSAVTYAVRVRNLESTDSGKLRLTKNGVKRAEAILSHNIS